MILYCLICFISGLIPELKREVIYRTPHSLLQTVSFAKLFHPSTLAPKHKFPYLPAKSLTQNTSKLSLTANINPPINTNPPPLLLTPPPKSQLTFNSVEKRGLFYL